MKKGILLCSLFSILMLMGFSFVRSADGTTAPVLSKQDSVSLLFGDSSICAFFSDIRSRHAEKLWLHMDKPYYAAGDTIWFKTYVINAVTHFRDTLSNYVYIDIVDRSKAVVLSKKIKRDSLGTFSNNFPLPVPLPSGEYTLRAYTGWMLNFDSGFFLQKNIYIGNAFGNKVNSSVTYTSEWAVVRFFDEHDKPYADMPASFKLFNKNNKVILSEKQSTSPTGALFVDLPSDSLRDGCYVKATLTRKDEEHTRTFFLQSQKRDYAVQFFPEGGSFIVNAPRIVAFKAEASDGYPTEVSGVIVNRKGDTITSFQSEHDGMGTFLLIPQQGENYRALCSCGEKSITVGLPEVGEQTCAITVIQSDSRIRYKIDGTIPKGSILVGHVRGMCCMIQPVDMQSCKGVIPVEYLPAGILHLLLVDSSGYPRSERLVFVPETHPEKWTVSTDKSRYGKRQQVTVDIAVERNGEPIRGDFSVSITDSKTIKYDPAESHIYFNLLLCSDLKGYIHHPGYYFMDNSLKTRHHLDLVMLTHGWRRFRTETFARTEPFRPKYFFEHGQYIAGHIVGIVGKPAPQARVNAVALTDHTIILGNATADRNGNFVIDGLVFCDTTVFILMAKSKKGRPVQAIEVDSGYPKPAFMPIHPYRMEEKTLKRQMHAYMQGVKEQSGIQNGMKVYTLRDAVVTAQDPRKPRMASMDSRVFDKEYFGKFASVPLNVYLRSLPYVSYLQGLLWLKNVLPTGIVEFTKANIPAEIIINGQKRDNNHLIGYMVEDVEYIHVIRGHGYAIEIVLKKGHERGSPEYPAYRMVGYARSVEFYHPAYDTPEKIENSIPDKRTTLYWNPNLQIGSDGKIQIKFYSDDTEDPQYQITIEGVDPLGSIYRYQYRTD